MRIAVIGAGYVGLVTGACLASEGHEVLLIEKDEKKRQSIENRCSPFYEPGLNELLADAYNANKITCVKSLSEVCDYRVVFICVGTPSDSEGNADLKYVFQAASDIAENISKDVVVCVKSTVPPGTTKNVEKIIRNETQSKCKISMAMCPEFLKEGSAVNDFRYPDRVVIGCEDDDTANTMGCVFHNVDLIQMNIVSAELTKYAANCMLASRISLMNEFSRLCDAYGGDIDSVRIGIGRDNRIGNQFLYAGPGYGGSCFPKDVKAVISFADKEKCQVPLIEAIDQTNDLQKEYFADRVKVYVDPEDKVAIWGLAFKANTDDMRDSPAIKLVESLRDYGVEKIEAYDPQSMENAKKMKQFAGVEFGQQMDVILNANVLVIVTDWNEFKKADFDMVRRAMAGNPTIVDGRNLFDVKQMEERYGFEYVSIGR